MNNNETFLYRGRDYKTIEPWKDIEEKDWLNPVWQLKNSIRTLDQLKKVIRLSEYQAQEVERVVATLRNEGKEPLRITPYYASLMQEDPFHPVMLDGEKGENRLDPIFWQSVPTPANLFFPDTGLEGAMDEGSRSYGACYQRYPNRVALFVAENTSCASYCVHCQRAKSLDSSVDVNSEEIDKALFYIKLNTNIDEVLVTGGDALMVSKNRLKYILEELGKIPHLRSIRIATRVPVVLPMAITDDLLLLIEESASRYSSGIDKNVYFMTHINHHQEITQELYKAVKKIQSHGFTIRNQTVLLNHVNNNYKTLSETFRRMFWVGVHPYYMLQCHKEKGIVHFITPIQIGKIYMKHMQGWLSGSVIPKYAANIEGGGGKVMLIPSGHDTLHTGSNIEDKIAESYANVSTWDNRDIFEYEALGRTTKEEFDQAVRVMDQFIGRSGVFLPKLIIVNRDGQRLRTTNRSNLPGLEKIKKAQLLGYRVKRGAMPLTNPAEINLRLDELYRKSNQ